MIFGKNYTRDELPCVLKIRRSKSKLLSLLHIHAFWKSTDCVKRHRFSQFSITSDITAANPATLLRSAGYASATVLFCSTEPNIDGSPHGIIRFLFYYYGKAVPIYLGGAEKLRPDLFNHTA